MRPVSRKQVNVIYRAYKEGKLELTKEDISSLYDLADYDMFICNTNAMQEAEKLHYGMSNVISFIFEGDYKMAMSGIDRLLHD